MKLGSRILITREAVQSVLRKRLWCSGVLPVLKWHYILPSSANQYRFVGFVANICLFFYFEVCSHAGSIVCVIFIYLPVHMCDGDSYRSDFREIPLSGILTTICIRIRMLVKIRQK
jgi:Ni,Fe-hydrogenase I cytochrome b subunit